MSLPPLRRRWPDLALAALLALFGCALYRHCLGLFFLHDDFFHLRFVARTGVSQLFFDRASWATLPFRMLTPLLFASLRWDLLAFGPAPRAFYTHQLLALGLGGAALFVLLRLWLPRRWSFLGGALYLLGAPVGAGAALLMSRHYFEALLAAAAAVATFVLAVRRDSSPWAWCSAALYLCASLAKEVAVPLPFGLLLLREGRLGGRLRSAAPHGGALVLYCAYRTWLLGTLGGGYGWEIRPGGGWTLLLSLPLKAARELAGSGRMNRVPFTLADWGDGSRSSELVGWLWLGLLGAACLPLLRRLGGALRWGGAGALALLPVLPVSTEMAERYALPLWLLVCAAVAVGCSRWPLGGEVGQRHHLTSWGAGVGAAALLLVGLLAHRASWRETLASAERISAENRFLWSRSSGSLLLRPHEVPASLAELRAYRRERRGDTGPAWSYDELALCGAEPGPLTSMHPEEDLSPRIWEFDAASGGVRERRGEKAALCARWQGRLRPQAPLSLTFDAQPSVLSWHLGPYADGRYALLLASGESLIRLPQEGAFQRPRQPLAFRLRYESPLGWITYSPELAADFPRRPRFHWHRP